MRTTPLLQLGSSHRDRVIMILSYDRDVFLIGKGSHGANEIVCPDPSSVHCE